jgi:hypothetical protein
VRRLALTFGIADGVAAALAVFGVFGALPARWWAVDTVTIVLAALLAAGALGLIRGTAWAERVARWAAFAALGVGLVLIATLAFTASYLAGIYGPVGRGGAIILVLVAALALPYLVVLPAAQLVWLRSASGAEGARVSSVGRREGKGS